MESAQGLFKVHDKVSLAGKKSYIFDLKKKKTSAVYYHLTNAQ